MSLHRPPGAFWICPWILLGVFCQPVATLAAAPGPEPARILAFSASASAEVLQDWVSLTLAHQVEAPDAATVQKQLTQVMNRALERARGVTAVGQREVSTGALQVSPRYANDGRMSGWTGRGELILAGRDLAGLATLAGQLSGLSVAQVQWSLSAALRQQTEEQVQAQAVQRFRAKASTLTEQFGFKAYALREIQVSEGGPGRPVQSLLARSMAMADAPTVPLEAGRTLVQVTVGGTVQFQP